MYVYEKRLQCPVDIKMRNPKIAQVIISQYGGPDGEMGASMRYMAQKFTFKNPRVAGLLNDIATEEPVGNVCHSLMYLYSTIIGFNFFIQNTSHSF